MLKFLLEKLAKKDGFHILLATQKLKFIFPCQTITNLHILELSFHERLMPLFHERLTRPQSMQDHISLVHRVR